MRTEIPVQNPTTPTTVPAESDDSRPAATISPPTPSPDEVTRGTDWAGMVEYASWLRHLA